jgi:hypothetical protein
MENVAKIGSQKLLFGNYAIRRFCRLQGCTNDPTTILQVFGKKDQVEDAFFNMVRAGVESAYAESKEATELTDFDVSSLIDKLSDSKDKGDSVQHAFMGSVIGIPASEVPAWSKDVLKKAEELAAQEAKAEKKADAESPNVPAVPVDSPAGKKSKAAPSVTV